jgi:flavin reductase (DIM6/NTAB) family NADH-FMN oxidoreductase RutF
VHLLGQEQAAMAAAFASRSEDKFTNLIWSWDGMVPRLAGVPVYLLCTVAALLAATPCCYTQMSC